MVVYRKVYLLKVHMRLDHESAWADEQIYKEIYENATKCPEEFWAHHSKDIYWHRNPNSIFDDRSGLWFAGGLSNVCYNCVDRHAITYPTKTAIIWYGDSKEERREISFCELKNAVIKIASRLRAHRIKKGDVVGIYMPMSPEAIAAMLACTRIGAVHLVVFAGFSPEALAYRLKEANAKAIITVTSMRRSGRTIGLLDNVGSAVKMLESIVDIINLDQDEEMEQSESIEWMDANDNLFVLYTSGSSGKPKGIVHKTLPYLSYVTTTFKMIFGIKEDDVYFCTSDIGWITGHSYITYAPLFYGLTCIIFSGSPTYPEADRYWEIIEKEKVSIFYSAPTAIRSLQMFNESFVKRHDLSSLRLLGNVGEPINKSAWQWYFEKVGNKRCPIMDTWWQTETGGIILAPLRSTNQAPGIAGRPFFGVKADVVNGELVILNRWPGLCSSVIANGRTNQLRNIRPGHISVETLYFKNGVFSTGDGATYIGADIKVTGRIDDVINISGHRLGTAEFEGAINKLAEVKESAVVAVSDEIKGQAAFAFVVLNSSDNSIEKIVKKILLSIKDTIGAIAKTDYIAIVSELPKTRSGKIVRHLLKKIANRETEINDTSSVVNPAAITSAQAATKNPIFCPDMCKL